MQILIVPLIVLLAVSLIGIPIIPLFILGLFVCLLLGLTSVFYLVGSRIKHTDDPKQSLIGKFALGFIVIMALPILGALIRIISPVGGLFSVLGFVILYVVATIGLGAAFYTLVAHKRQ
jgi:O-antigen/teichoic acid export membrane protein